MMTIYGHQLKSKTDSSLLGDRWGDGKFTDHRGRGAGWRRGRPRPKLSALPLVVVPSGVSVRVSPRSPREARTCGVCLHECPGPGAAAAVEGSPARAWAAGSGWLLLIKKLDYFTRK